VREHGTGETPEKGPPVNRDRNKPKRVKVLLDERSGQGHTERVTPAVLERIHNEAAPAWTRKEATA